MPRGSSTFGFENQRSVQKLEIIKQGLTRTFLTSLPQAADEQPKSESTDSSAPVEGEVTAEETMQRGEPESSQEEPEKSLSNEEDSREKVDLSECVSHLLVLKLFLACTQQIFLVSSN